MASPSAGAPLVGKCVLPPAIQLSASPLLQGRALHSLLSLLRALASSASPGLGFSELYAALRAGVDKASAGSGAGGGRAAAAASQPLPKQSVANVARCLAALLVQCPYATRDATVLIDCTRLFHTFLPRMFLFLDTSLYSHTPFQTHDLKHSTFSLTPSIFSRWATSSRTWTVRRGSRGASSPS